MTDMQITIAGRTVGWEDVDDQIGAGLLAALVQSLGPARERS